MIKDVMEDGTCKKSDYPIISFMIYIMSIKN